MAWIKRPGESLDVQKLFLTTDGTDFTDGIGGLTFYHPCDPCDPWSIRSLDAAWPP
jgi:hypothetical protein